MNISPKKRRLRCSICLVIVALVTVFLVGDALRFENAGATPGPAYLVMWLGMILSGAVALVALAADLIWTGLHPRRSRKLAPAEAELEAVATLMPRA